MFQIPSPYQCSDEVSTNHRFTVGLLNALQVLQETSANVFQDIQQDIKQINHRIVKLQERVSLADEKMEKIEKGHEEKKILNVNSGNVKGSGFQARQGMEQLFTLNTMPAAYKEQFEKIQQVPGVQAFDLVGREQLDMFGLQSWRQRYTDPLAAYREWVDQMVSKAKRNAQRAKRARKKKQKEAKSRLPSSPIMKRNLKKITLIREKYQKHGYLKNSQSTIENSPLVTHQSSLSDNGQSLTDHGQSLSDLGETSLKTLEPEMSRDTVRESQEEKTDDSFDSTDEDKSPSEQEAVKSTSEVSVPQLEPTGGLQPPSDIGKSIDNLSISQDVQLQPMGGLQPPSGDVENNVPETLAPLGGLAPPVNLAPLSVLSPTGGLAPPNEILPPLPSLSGGLQPPKSVPTKLKQAKNHRASQSVRTLPKQDSTSKLFMEIQNRSFSLKSTKTRDSTEFKPTKANPRDSLLSEIRSISKSSLKHVETKLPTMKVLSKYAASSEYSVAAVLQRATQMNYIEDESDEESEDGSEKFSTSSDDSW